MPTYTKQPSSKDNYIYSYLHTSNYGSLTYMALYNNSASSAIMRGILEFDISDLPDGAEITSATLYLYYYNYTATGGRINPVGTTALIYKLYPDKVTPSEVWEELQSTWDIYKTGENWDTAGGDYKTSDPDGASDTFPASPGAWMDWDVLAIVEDAISNENDLVKLLLKYGNESGGYGSLRHVFFYTKDYTGDPDLCPKLVIEYTLPIIKPTSIPSEESFGIPTLKYDQTVSPVSIPSAESFGIPFVSFPQYLYPVSIPSAEAFGVPFVCHAVGVTSYDVAVCSYAAAVYAFRIGTDGHLYRRESTDSGDSWGSWVDMGDISADENTRLAACFKDADEAIVLWSTQDVDSESKMIHYTRHQYYQFFPVYSDNYNAQTFTTGPAFELTKLKLKLYRVGSPGTLTVAIKAVDGSGHPTGDDLTTGTLDSIELTHDPQGAWYEFDVTNYSLSASTKYAILLRLSGGSANKNVYWISDTFGSYYSGGNMELSDDAGTSWWTYSISDKLFQVWGHFEARLYRRRLSGGSWESAANWANHLRTITGIDVYYEGDWNVVVSGNDLEDQAGVWTCILGDGYGGAPGTWYSLAPLIIRDCAESFAYSFPNVCKIDVTRLFFVEAHADVEAHSRPYFTHSLPTAEFLSNLWREPIPFNLDSQYGLAIAHHGDYVWLSRPDGIWRSLISPSTVDVSADILDIQAVTKPFTGSVVLTLRNDDGRYNAPGSGYYEALTRGAELRLRWGYHTTSGPLHGGYAPTTWIDSYDYVVKGGKSYFLVYAYDGWSLLDRWHARREYNWELGDKNIFQLLSFVFSRVGLELSSYSLSSAIQNQEPAFTIAHGESGQFAVKRLLAMVPDVILFVGDCAYLKNPSGSDSSAYSYGGDHAIKELTVRTVTPSVNRAQVIGLDIFTEDFDWDEISLVHDRLIKVEDENLITTTAAHERGDALLRESDIAGPDGAIIVPMNCGQELYDVIDLTSPQAGLNATNLRILALSHTWTPSKARYTLNMGVGAP